MRLRASPIHDSYILWLYDIAQFTPHIGAYYTCLDEIEHHYATKFRHDIDRNNFLSRRIILRHLLAQLIGGEASEIDYKRGPGGKLSFITANCMPVHWHFNTSHAGKWTIIALSRRSEIGVDIESPIMNAGLTAIARDNFTQIEQTWLSQSTTDDRFVSNFYRLWTAKEATLKYLGTGLLISPHKIEILIDENRINSSSPDTPPSFTPSPAWPPVLHSFSSTGIERYGEASPNSPCLGYLATEHKTCLHHIFITSDTL